SQTREFVASQMDKGWAGLLTPWRLWCTTPRIPIGDLGHVLDALLVGISIFFCEPKLVGVQTKPHDQSLLYRLAAPEFCVGGNCRPGFNRRSKFHGIVRVKFG